MLVVPANSDIKSLADLTAKIKANPSGVTWAVGSAVASTTSSPGRS